MEFLGTRVYSLTMPIKMTMIFNSPIVFQNLKRIPSGGSSSGHKGALFSSSKCEELIFIEDQVLNNAIKLNFEVNVL